MTFKTTNFSIETEIQDDSFEPNKGFDIATPISVGSSKDAILSGGEFSEEKGFDCYQVNNTNTEIIKKPMIPHCISIFMMRSKPFIRLY